MTVAMNDLSVTRPATREFLGTEHRNFIDGQWCAAVSGRTLAVIDPATGQTISRVADSDADDVNLAVQAARRAFEQAAWQRMKPALRERLLHRLADLMAANIDILAELESIDNGKSVAVATAVDLPCAIDCLRFMAGMPSKLNGSTLKPSVPFSSRRRVIRLCQLPARWRGGRDCALEFPPCCSPGRSPLALAAGCTGGAQTRRGNPLDGALYGEAGGEAGFPRASSTW